MVSASSMGSVQRAVVAPSRASIARGEIALQVADIAVRSWHRHGHDLGTSRVLGAVRARKAD